jgi:WD40 repeat protein
MSQQISELPAGRLGRLRTWAQQDPTRAALAAALVLTALTGAALSTYYALEARRRAEAIRQNQAAVEEARQAVEAREVALYETRIALAQRQWQANNVTACLELLDACRRGDRGWEWHYLRRLCSAFAWRVQPHAGAVWAAAGTPDGRRWVTAGSDGKVHFLDAATGAVVRTYRGYRLWSPAVAFSAGGEEAVSVGRDGVQVWRVDDPQSKRTLTGPVGRTTCVAFSGNGRLVAAGGWEGAAVWEAATGRPCAPGKGPTGRVYNLAFTPDAGTLALACGREGLLLWDLHTGRLRPLVNPGVPGVGGVALSPDGRQVACCGLDQTIRVLDAETGRQSLPAVEGNLACFSPDGARLASAAADRVVALWDAHTGARLATLRGHREPVQDLAFGPDGRLVSVSGRGAAGPGGASVHGPTPGEVIAWDTARPQAAARLEAGAPVIDLSLGRAGRLAALTRQGDPTARHSDEDAVVTLWDSARPRQVRRLPRQAENSWPVGVALRPDGAQVAVAYDRFDPASATPVAGVEGDAEQYGRLREQGKDVWYFPAAGGGLVRVVGLNGQLKLFDWGGGEGVHTFDSPSHGIHATAFSPDGRLLAAGVGHSAIDKPGEVVLWDVAGRSRVRTLSGLETPVRDLCFSGDGRRLAGAGYWEVVVWDVETGRTLGSFRGHRGFVTGVALDADGGRLATCGVDGTLLLWDTASSRTLLPPFHGHLGGVRGVAFSPDGGRVASAGRDGSVRVWNARTGHELLELRGHNAMVSCIRFHPDGLLASAGGLAVLLWDGRPTPDVSR